MAIRLGIDHGSATHRFVHTMTITVTADGAAVPEVSGVSVPGARRFDIPDTAKAVEIDIRIAKPAASMASDLLRIKQPLTVSTASGAPTLAPSGGFRPRLQPAAGSGAATKPGGVFRLDLDVTFLDTTDYWRTTAPTAPLPTTHGTTLRMLECTSGGPPCWAVFLPPAVPTSTTAANILMFLRPTYKGTTYTNTDDVGTALMLSAERYLRDQGGTTATGAAPFGLGDSAEFPTYGGHGCGFERQLVDAAKPVILLWPLNRGVDYGDAVSARMPAMLASAVTALWSAQAIGAGASSVTLRRVGVAGYSAGGLAALNCFEANRDHIDELYLFDPGKFPVSLATVSPFQAWLKAKTGRKLRMIGGGYQHGRMLGFAGFLASPDATCWPPTADAWFTDASYKRGLSDAGTPLAFTAVGTTAPAGSPSDVTGIFVVPPYTPSAKATLKLRGLPAPGAKADAALGISLEEAASIATIHALSAVTSTKVDASSFAKVIDRILNDPDPSREKPRIAATRHEWTVFGGMDFGAGYRGFLQQALALSGF